MEHDLGQFDEDNKTEAKEIIKQLDFLDTADGLQRCMEDEDFYLDIVSTFVEDNVLADLQKYYLSNDWSGYRVKVHALKSSSAYIGAEELRARAKRMEDAAKQEDVEYINLHHHKLLAMYEDLLRNITAILPKRINLAADSPIKQFTIFVVDDSLLNRQVVSEVLSEVYNIREAKSGHEFFQQLENGTNPDLVLLDVHMPQESGHDIICKLKEDDRFAGIPVVFMTHDEDISTELQGFKEGAVDFVTKPINPAVLMARISRILELYYLNAKLQDEVQIRTKDILEKSHQMTVMFDQIIQALANTIDAKDTYTKGHSDRVSQYSVMIGTQLGYTEMQLVHLKYAALLHDIGKIGIPDNIINKPGSLTEEEFSIIKKHPVIGGDILKTITSVDDIYYGALYHHENYDGTGYPEGLAGKDIPEMARIIKVADAYDAMTSRRSYRRMLNQQQVRLEMEQGLGRQFDPIIGSIMLHIIDDDTEFKLHE